MSAGWIFNWIVLKDYKSIHIYVNDCQLKAGYCRLIVELPKCQVEYRWNHSQAFSSLQPDIGLQSDHLLQRRSKWMLCAGVLCKIVPVAV